MITLTIPEAASALDITEFLVSSLIRLGVIRAAGFKFGTDVEVTTLIPSHEVSGYFASASNHTRRLPQIRTSSTPMAHLSITSSRLRLNHRSRHAAQRNSAQPS